MAQVRIKNLTQHRIYVPVPVGIMMRPAQEVILSEISDDLLAQSKKISTLVEKGVIQVGIQPQDPEIDDTLETRFLGAGGVASHATTHHNGGSDVVDVVNLRSTGGLSGEILTADGLGGLSFVPPGAPAAHASTHQDGGADEVATATPAANAIPKADGTGKLAGGWVAYGSSASTAVEGNDARMPTTDENDALAGTDGTPGSSNKYVTDSDGRMSDARTPTAHASSHSDGGTDEVDVVDLGSTSAPASGYIPTSDGAGGLGWQTAGTPAAHSATHQDGGADEVATGTPAANAIPKALGTGKLATGWLDVGTGAGTVAAGNDSRIPTQGENDALVGTNGTPATGNPYVTDSDPRNTNARTPTSHSSSHSAGGSDEVDAANLASDSAPSTGYVLASAAGDTCVWTTPSAPGAHASTHSDGGADEVDVGNLGSTSAPGSGYLVQSDGTGGLGWVTASAPGPHASTHQDGGADEIATATAAANAIPKANSGGTFNAGWVDDTAHGTRGGGTQHALATTSVAGFMSGTDKTSVDKLTSQLGDTTEPNGFPDRTSSQMSFTDGTLTFAIQPTAANYSFWSDGTRYTKTGTDSKVITDTEGVWYFYFDASGVLQGTQTWSDDFVLRFALVAIVYWDATNDTAIYFADERHGLTMDGVTHRYLHNVFGAQWVSGLGLSQMTVDGDGNTNAAAQFAVNDGVIYDEDVEHSIVDDNPQDLFTTADIPVYYRDGAAGDWRKKTADNFPLIYNGAPPGYTGTLIPYNNIQTGNWTLIQLTNGQFMVMHYFATNNIAEPIVGIIGQAAYNSVKDARDGVTTELNGLLIGMPLREFTPLASVIYETATSFANTPKARVRSVATGVNYVDWRGSEYTPGVGVTNDLPLHATTHENGGVDELDVTGLSGTLADPQTPAGHAASHQNGGADEVATATPAANAIPKAQAGGTLAGGWVTYGSSASTAVEGNDSRVPTQDENDALVGTNGTPATANPYVTDSDPRNTDARTPTSHAASHQNGGGDEVATATPTANSIPKTGAGTALAGGWIPYGTSASTATEGNDSRVPTQDENDALVGTNGTPATGNPYVTDSDPRNTDSRAPTGTASGQLGGTYPGPDVRGIRTTTGPTLLTIGAIADGQLLTRSGSTVVGSTPSGTGDVIGPSGATDEAIARYNTATGKLLQDSLVTIDDAGSISLPASQTVDGRDVSVDGAKLDTLVGGAVTKEVNGFPNLTDSTISFVGGGSLTFTIAPTGASFDYYRHGVQVTKSSSENVIISNTSGLWFIYYNATAVLTASLAVWDVSDVVPVATVYWNASTSSFQMAEERHGVTMDWATHEYLHRTVGTRYINGFNLSGYTLDTDSDAAVTFGLTNGAIADEDLTLSITHSATPSSFFEQVLLDPAEVPVYYRSGGSGDWVWDTATTFAFKNTSSGRVNFNEFTGGAWQQTQATSDYFVAVWVVATDHVSEPIIALQGQRQDATLLDAERNNTYAALNIAPMPQGETRLLYRIILQTSDSFGGTRLAKIQAVDDFRTLLGAVAEDLVLESVGGRPGILVDPQEPRLHASTHEPGGSDALSAITFYNGTILETFDATVTSDGATVTLSLQKSGGGDVTLRFSDGYTTLDCTPAATIALTAGSDTAPQENYVYIPQSTKVLTISTSDWPSGEHVKVSYVLVPSAGFVQADGSYVHQNWNDHAAGTDNQGHLAHLTEHIRLTARGGVWHSGASTSVNITVNPATPDNVDVSVAAGVVFQAHRHATPAQDTSTGDSVLVVNHNTTPYQQITDLNTQLTDAGGSSMQNSYFNLVVWAVANKTSSYAPLMLNLPTGSYTTRADAINDVDGRDVFTLPTAFSQESSTGFLLARFTFLHVTTAGGTWTLENTTDLRGLSPFAAAGGVSGGASTTEFADNQFKILDNGDASKTMQFEAAGITAGQNRILTIPDASGTIGLLTSATPADVTKAAAAAGTATDSARADHKHDVTTATPAIGIGGGNSEGSATTLSRSDHGHAIRTTTGPTDLTVGAITDGQYLQRSGTSIIGAVVSTTDELVGVTAADTTPSYLQNKVADGVGITTTVLTPGGDEDLQIAVDFATATPADVTKAAAVTGTVDRAAREDHKHDVTTAAPTVGVGTGNSEGSATTLARSDHGHVLRETGGPTNLTMATIPDGTFLQRSGTQLVGVSPSNVFDIRDVLVFDHFATGNVDSDEIGSQGWRITSTGAGSETTLAAVAGHPGVVGINPGASAGGYVSLHLGDALTGTTFLVGGSNPIEFEAMMRITGSINSTDLEGVQLGFGLEWSTVAQHSNGVFVRFFPGTDTTFVMVATNGGTATANAGTTTVLLNTWYRVGFIISNPGTTPSAQMYVNGTAEGSAVTTNFPTAGITFGHKIDGAGATTDPILQLDYVRYTQTNDLED